ncbi:progressive ankylosis protein homolog B-like isoform X4 [Watersipora subatra]|uniref:progressive ankylosis protein homolog B-like isoform X4 n=1 Tax=Watersipora subatra TaxID=2589382 RepID=UPI00355BD09E
MADPTTKGVDQEELTRDEDKIAECNSDGKEIISHSFALNNACKDNSRDVVAIDDMEAAGLFGKFRKVRQFWMLLRFIAPLAVTQMVPDLAEQAINRGITSTASDEMVQLLASYGLAVYVTRWFAATAIELRHVSIVLVNSKRDNTRMTIMCIVIGLLLSVCVILLGLTPAGTWLIRDIHGHNQEVSDLTNRLMTLLGPVPLIEALANYYEGGLIHFKLTAYAGIARFTDFGMQVLFVLLLLFTSKTIEPMFVPIYSVYAGYVARLILDAGFCYVLVRRKLPETHGTEKPLTVSKALRFWMPLACVRLVQDISRPLLNLVVSRNLSVKVGKEAAAKAIAVLTAVYPTDSQHVCLCLYSFRVHHQCHPLHHSWSRICHHAHYCWSQCRARPAQPSASQDLLRHLLVCWTSGSSLRSSDLEEKNVLLDAKRYWQTHRFDNLHCEPLSYSVIRCCPGYNSATPLICGRGYFSSSSGTTSKV